MGKSLVIVESPAKARTISKFLGRDYVVESSIGHIRDLPNSAKEIPPAIKKEPWARLGIDIENDFQPYYVIPTEKRRQVAKLKELVKKADELYLATDEDREGEAISWHLCDVLKPKIPRKRLVFHEITREAIKQALANPRDIDERLVRAQETRRILDRLFGYEISPVLWRKIAPRLSAGRVQSVAVRMIVERERARMRFVAASYWDLLAAFDSASGAPAPGFPFEAALILLEGRRVATGRDFDDHGKFTANPAEVVVLDEKTAAGLVDKLMKEAFQASSIESKPYSERPAAPFTTSTLQQEANRKLRLPARVTMQIAQRLYENGYITYMRTDSTSLSDEAVRLIRELVSDLYGGEYLPREPRFYQTKVRNAQEAHEAIRPAGDTFRRPEELRGEINDDELRVYDLIWKRAVASQMPDARGQRQILQVKGDEAVFQATGKTIQFPGFLRAYVEGSDDPEADLADKETILPPVKVGDPLLLTRLEPKGHATQPPPRFTEASLVKELEANGVGRPSTYATIIDTIQQRDYVVKQGSALVPTFTAFAVVGLLEKNFGALVDTQFTARMEDDLDAISRGEQNPVPYLKGFYFGGPSEPGLKDLIQADIDPRESCTLPLGKDSEGREVNVRIGRYGPYLERGGDRAPIPEGMAPEALTLEAAARLLGQVSGPKLLGRCPATGKPVYARSGRFGPYFQMGESEDNPKMKSLLPGMKLEEATLEQALEVLSLPRGLGPDPETGEEVIADYGRYGQYLKRGAETRSFYPPDHVLTIGLGRALQIFKETPKERRGAPKLLRELGTDQGSGKAIRMLSGRFGPYVSDGELNANIPRSINLEELTLTEALGLLKARAERQGWKGKGRFRAKPVEEKKSMKTTKTTKKKSPPAISKKKAKRF